MRSGNNMSKKDNYGEPDDNLSPEDQEEQFDELNPEDLFDEFERDHVPTRKEIAEQDGYLLRRQQEFRLAADAIVVAFSRSQKLKRFPCSDRSRCLCGRKFRAFVSTGATGLKSGTNAPMSTSRFG